MSTQVQLRRVCYLTRKSRRLGGWGARGLRGGETVKIEKEGGITWVILNRPEKRNAMNPQMHYDILDAVVELETDEETRVLVLTGAGDSWCAGQDLKQFFRDLENKPAERRRAGWASQEWRWRRLFTF